MTITEATNESEEGGNNVGETENASKSANDLRERHGVVLENRVHRKAKDVAASSLSFLVAVVSILFSIQKNVEESDGELYLPTQVVAFCVLLIVYALVLSVAVTVHALWHLPPGMTSSLEIEAAYAKTNKWILVDGFLEIPTAFAFGCGRFAGVVWTIYFVAVLTTMMLLFTTVFDMVVFLSTLLAIFSLYRITAELCEYRVLTTGKPL